MEFLFNLCLFGIVVRNGMRIRQDILNGYPQEDRRQIILYYLIVVLGASAMSLMMVSMFFGLSTWMAFLFLGFYSGMVLTNANENEIGGAKCS